MAGEVRRWTNTGSGETAKGLIGNPVSVITNAICRLWDWTDGSARGAWMARTGTFGEDLGACPMEYTVLSATMAAAVFRVMVRGPAALAGRIYGGGSLWRPRWA